MAETPVCLCEAPALCPVCASAACLVTPMVTPTGVVGRCHGPTRPAQLPRTCSAAHPAEQREHRRPDHPQDKSRKAQACLRIRRPGSCSWLAWLRSGTDPADGPQPWLWCRAPVSARAYRLTFLSSCAVVLSCAARPPSLASHGQPTLSLLGWFDHTPVMNGETVAASLCRQWSSVLRTLSALSAQPTLGQLLSGART